MEEKKESECPNTLPTVQKYTVLHFSPTINISVDKLTEGDQKYLMDMATFMMNTIKNMHVKA